MPYTLARACIYSDEAVPKKVGAFAIGSVIVIRRRSHRQKSNAAFFIDGYFAPYVNSPDIFVSVFRPSVVTELSGLRNGMERPNKFARHRGVGAHMTGRGEIIFTRRGPHDDQVFEYEARHHRLYSPDRRCLPTQSFTQVDISICSEIHD